SLSGKALGRKVLGGSFLTNGTVRLLLSLSGSRYTPRSIKCCMKRVCGGEIARPSRGYSESEAKDLYRCRSCYPDRYLGRSSAQFCAQPPSWFYRSRRRGGRQAGRPVAFHHQRSDGARHPLPQVHALTARQGP